MALELSQTRSMSSPLGSVPSGWKLAKLKDITTKIGTGATPRGGDKVYLSTRKNFALIRSQHVFDRYFNTEGLAFISDEHAAELHKVSVQAGDLLLNITGDGITFARACVVPESILPACVNQHVAIIRADTSLCLPRYLLSYLTHPLIKQYIESFNSGGSRRAITKGHIESFIVPLPRLPEQKAIAHILGTLDDKIELNREMNKTLEAMARAIFKSWFVDFDPVRAKMEGRQPVGMDAATAELFPNKFEESALGMIPKGWKISTIGESVKVVGGGTPSTKNPDYWGDGSIYWTTPKDLAFLQSPVLLDTERKITEQGLKQISSGLLPKGTVLLSSRAPIGYLAISDVSVAINQGYIAMVCDGNLPNYYILYWALENMEVIKGRANGTTFLEISKSNFRPIEILIPNSKVLDKFIVQVEALYHQIVNNLKQSRTLASIRDTLLPKLLSGEIRVKKAEKIVETQL